MSDIKKIPSQEARYKDAEFLIGLCQTISSAVLVALIAQADKIIHLVGNIGFAMAFISFCLSAMISVTCALIEYNSRFLHNKALDHIHTQQCLEEMVDALQETNNKLAKTIPLNETEENNSDYINMGSGFDYQTLLTLTNKRDISTDTLRICLFAAWILIASGFLTFPISFCLNKFLGGNN